MSEVWTDEQAGPASYPSGGFTIVTSLSAVDHASVRVKTPGPNLPPCEFRVTRSGASFTVQIIRHRYDRAGATLGAMSGLPSGVTARNTSGGQYDNESSHAHSMNHDHAAATSTNNTVAGGGVVSGLASARATHTHSFDPPNFSGNTGPGAAHTHTLDTLYQHQHAVTQTEANLIQSELPNGTDLSGTTFQFCAVDE